MNKNIDAKSSGKRVGLNNESIDSNVYEKLFSNINIMNKVEFSKSQLINLILQQNKTIKPIPRPRKSVKQMVQDYEDNIIEPPLEFRDDYKPIPAKRTKKQVIKKPVLLPRTIIKQTNKALKGYTTSYEISIKNNKDPLIQAQNT